MKKVAKLVVLSMVVVPFVFLNGCAKRCCPEPKPVCNKVERIERECGGCK